MSDCASMEAWYLPPPNLLDTHLREVRVKTEVRVNLMSGMSVFLMSWCNPWVYFRSCLVLLLCSCLYACTRVAEFHEIVSEFPSFFLACSRADESRMCRLVVHMLRCA